MHFLLTNNNNNKLGVFSTSARQLLADLGRISQISGEARESEMFGAGNCLLLFSLMVLDEY